MSSAYTAALRPESHDPTEALVNTGGWEPVAIEASLYFPAIYIGYSQKLSWEEGYEQPNYQYANELELKATP